MSRAEYNRAYYAKHKDKVKAKVAARAAARTDEERAAQAEYNRAYYEANQARIKAKAKETRRLHQKRWVYGVTHEEWEEMLRVVDHKCPLCSRPFDDLFVKPTLDHDHDCCNTRGEKTCGRCVRGPLCGACNKALGFAERIFKQFAR